MDIIQGQLLNLLSTLLVALISVAVSFGIKWLKSKGVLAKLETNKAIVNDVVNFVEQVSADLNIHGADKFNKAKERIVNILNTKGIKITDEEIQTLIENAVKTMNDAIQKENK